MDIIILITAVTLFVLALFWIVRPIRRLPFVQRLQRLTNIPSWLIYGMIVPALLLLFAFINAFPESVKRTESPNYPASALFVIWAIYFVGNGLILHSFPAEANVDDRPRYAHPLHVALLFVYALLSIACIFPDWFGLKHVRDIDTPWYSGFIVLFLIWPVAFPRKPASQAELSSNWRELADQGSKLAAAKVCRAEQGISLMEAKETVEDYLNSHKYEG